MRTRARDFFALSTGKPVYDVMIQDPKGKWVGLWSEGPILFLNENDRNAFRRIICRAKKLSDLPNVVAKALAGKVRFYPPKEKK